MKKFISVLLSVLMSLGLAYPAFASYQVRDATVIQVLSEEILIPEYAKYFTEEELQEAEKKALEKNVRQPRSVLGIVTAIIAIHGAGYNGGYAVGEYAFNHGYSRNGFLKTTVSIALGATVGAAFKLGYDNGYVAASKA